MSTFNVRWEEDFEADSPLEAVERARALLADGSLAFFTITTERGDELEMDVGTGKLRYTLQIPEHKHTFVGDEDTCTAHPACPVTWGQRMAEITKEQR